MAKEYEIQGITFLEYQRIHVWLRKNKPTSGVCAHCEEIDTLQNALILGMKYEWNVENFISLCSSCHSIYDKTGYIATPRCAQLKKLFIHYRTRIAFGDPHKISHRVGASSQKVKMILYGVVSNEELAEKIFSELMILIENRRVNKESYIQIGSYEARGYTTQHQQSA